MTSAGAILISPGGVISNVYLSYADILSSAIHA